MAYDDYFKTASPTIEDARSMVESYMMTGNTKSAEDWLAKIITYDGHTADDVFNYAIS